MSYANPRIKLEMTMLDVICVMSEGNPGAMWVLMEIIQKSNNVDPQSFLGPLGPICHLDNADIYGARIWMLYKDICGQNVPKMIGLLRASQLGITNDGRINQAMDRTCELDLPVILAEVQAKLPNFKLEPA